MHFRASIPRGAFLLWNKWGGLSARIRTVIATVIVLVAGLAYLGSSLFLHGFSAKEKPSRFEEFLARQARRFATPATARQLKNPHSFTPESLPAAFQHWSEHCALCHGFDGGGNTGMGQNLYPKVPDLSSSAVQALSDGELFYIIYNGIRFTGMPAWGSADSPEPIWHLVYFIRTLPKLTPSELEFMKERALQQIGATQEMEAHAHPH